MNDTEHQKIWNIFNDEIEGGCSSYMEAILEKAVENGYLDEDFWRDNEMAICVLFDNSWFTCEACGWTLPIGDMQDGESDSGAWVCQSCFDDGAD